MVLISSRPFEPSDDLDFARAENEVRRSGKFTKWASVISNRAESNVSEKHFSPTELAEAWGVSTETIRVIFRKEPGVLKLGRAETRYKRGYFTLRIPESVAQRVHHKLSA